MICPSQELFRWLLDGFRRVFVWFHMLLYGLIWSHNALSDSPWLHLGFIWFIWAELSKVLYRVMSTLVRVCRVRDSRCVS